MAETVKQIDDGGPVCSRCGSAAVRYQGHQHLCAKHYRFGQMRALAKRRGKSVPDHQELEGLVSDGNRCADCSRLMNWLAAEDQASVATLQHYRDGTYALVCRSCNTRHAYMPGDTYRDVPKDHKLCPKCNEVKPDREFCSDNSRSGPRKLKSHCRECSHKSHTEWRIKNRDHYNAKQRERRAAHPASA